MSLMKRKPSSLDPAQKQRKYRQCQYYALLDKCLQIPNDDKLILRKNVEEQEERLISLLEKYRKETPKDLKDLQIYLRKYIQKYKIDNPKYPTLKLAKSPQHSYSIQKRNSFSFSINTSKVTIDLGSSSSQMKHSFHIPAKKQVSSPHVKQQKSLLRLNSHMSRDEERNYEDLIRKRKTQKLKISEHRISVTIENESHSASFYKYVIKEQKVGQKGDTKDDSRILQIGKNFNFEPMMIESKVDQFQPQKIENKQFEKTDFLQTMRFRMKVDELEGIEKKSVPKFNEANPSYLIQNFIIPITTDESVFQTQLDERVLKKPENIQTFSSVKRKLFSNSQNLINQKVSDKQNTLKSKDNSRIRRPLQEINFDNTFSSIKKLQDMNSAKLPLQSSKKSLFENEINSSEDLNQKQKFNSGHKNSQDSILKELFSKNDDNQFFNNSQLRQQSKSNIYQQSRMKKQNDLNQVQSQYIKSQRKVSDLYSNRMLDENNRSFMNSFSKDKDEKESKSSRMIFSHRMQEVISGRKHQNQHEKTHEKSSLVSPSYSFREKKKGTSKLEFWARIQSTINE